VPALPEAGTWPTASDSAAAAVTVAAARQRAGVLRRCPAPA
jgi:hypothetical protein